MGAVFKSMEPIKELLCLWHFQVKGSHFAWLVLVSTRTMELYRSDAPLPSVGASLVKILSSIKNRSFPIRLGPFPGERTPNTAILYRMLPVAIDSKPLLFIRFNAKGLTASSSNGQCDDFEARLGQLLNRAEGWMKRSQLLETKTHPKQAPLTSRCLKFHQFGCHDVIYLGSLQMPSKSMGMKLYVNYSPKDNTPSNWWLISSIESNYMVHSMAQEFRYIHHSHSHMGSKKRISLFNPYRI